MKKHVWNLASFSLKLRSKWFFSRFFKFWLHSCFAFGLRIPKWYIILTLASKKILTSNSLQNPTSNNPIMMYIIGKAKSNAIQICQLTSKILTSNSLQNQTWSNPIMMYLIGKAKSNAIQICKLYHSQIHFWGHSDLQQPPKPIVKLVSNLQKWRFETNLNQTKGQGAPP